MAGRFTVKLSQRPVDAFVRLRRGKPYRMSLQRGCGPCRSFNPLADEVTNVGVSEKLRISGVKPRLFKDITITYDGDMANELIYRLSTELQEKLNKVLFDQMYIQLARNLSRITQQAVKPR
jgi:hypothetical protein